MNDSEWGLRYVVRRKTLIPSGFYALLDLEGGSLILLAVGNQPQIAVTGQGAVRHHLAY